MLTRYKLNWSRYQIVLNLKGRSEDLITYQPNSYHIIVMKYDDQSLEQSPRKTKTRSNEVGDLCQNIIR